MRTVVKASKGSTILATERPDMCGGSYWTATIIVEGTPVIRGTWHDGTGIAFPGFHEVFGKLGCRTVEMESIYYHAAEFVASMV